MWKIGCTNEFLIRTLHLGNKISIKIYIFEDILPIFTTDHYLFILDILLDFLYYTKNLTKHHETNIFFAEYHTLQTQSIGKVWIGVPVLEVGLVAFIGDALTSAVVFRVGVSIFAGVFTAYAQTNRLLLLQVSLII